MGYLSEAMRRRIAMVILVAGAVVIALAIANVGPFSNPPTEGQKAEATVRGFFDAARAKDFSSVCSFLTPQERHNVEVKGERVAAQQGLKGCGQIVGALAGKQLSQTRIATFDDARVSGPQAVVDVELAFPGAKQAVARTFHLLLIDQQWRISDFGL